MGAQKVKSPFRRVQELLLLAVGVLPLALISSAAHAEDPLQSITASPSIERLSLPSGGSYEGTVVITNTGRTPYEFTVATSPFSVQGEDYTQSFVPRPDLVDASKWFSFSRTLYPSQPGQETPVTYRIKAPADIAPGGYYAVLFAEAKNSSSPQQGITAHKRVGVLFYLTVSGDAVKGGKISNYQVPILHTSAPLKATAKIENTGNVHFDATTTVEISDMFGNVKARLESTNTVFPKSTRKVELAWNKAPGFGIFKVSGTVKYLDKTQTLPTRYTLMLSAGWFMIIAFVLVAVGGYLVMTRRSRGNVVRRRRR